MAVSPKPSTRQSQRIPWELEEALRVGVFDRGDKAYNGDPDLTIGNPQSGCFGVCHLAPEGTRFIFHHQSMARAKKCNCFIRGKMGGKTSQIPRELESLRMYLIVLGPYRMEPKFAAMVVMKLFLGLEIPDGIITGCSNIDYEVQQEDLQLLGLWILRGKGEPVQDLEQLDY
ncbi:hypothetical protein F5Y06DRAFT_298716 [Hypoxylon sp. FL0890]|nr:hypothetical protein F5Y06DRAFT_298716 [Hypoxylon sp. FL0890]